MVLAEGAAQVAAAEEEGARPAGAREGRLLAEVRQGGSQEGLPAYPASARLPR